jgi:hypothetical protein
MVLRGKMRHFALSRPRFGKTARPHETPETETTGWQRVEIHVTTPTVFSVTRRQLHVINQKYLWPPPRHESCFLVKENPPLVEWINPGDFQRARLSGHEHFPGF